MCRWRMLNWLERKEEILEEDVKHDQEVSMWKVNRCDS